MYKRRQFKDALTWPWQFYIYRTAFFRVSDSFYYSTLLLANAVLSDFI